MNFVSIDFWTLIFTWINLFILFLIMKKLLFKPVVNILKQREDEISSMYEKAQSASDSAKALEDEYTEKLKSAKEEASSIIKNATQTANEKGEQIVMDARKQASDTLLKAEKQIENEKNEASRQIKGDISHMACMIAEKVIERDINESDHERIVEEFIDSLGEDK